MTPTSATGKADRRNRRSGFTLVELMMTVAIIGLAAGAMVLALPDPQPSVSEAADAFAARLGRAREEAILANRTTAVEITPTGYAFASFDGQRWSPLKEGPFKPRAWDTAIIVDIDRARRIVFDPTGSAEPAEVVLTREGRSRIISVDGAGEVMIRG